MRNPTIVTELAVLLAGCATAKPVPLPNGHPGYAVEGCGRVSECYKFAAKTCGGPYDIVNESGGAIGTVSGTGGVVGTAYSLVIECKSSGSEPK